MSIVAMMKTCKWYEVHVFDEDGSETAVEMRLLVTLRPVFSGRQSEVSMAKHANPSLLPRTAYLLYLRTRN